MQKVERRQHKERKNQRWIWLAAALALLAGSLTLTLLLSREPVLISEEEPHWGLLIDRKPDELESVTVKRKGEAPWTLVRTEEGSLRPEGNEIWTVAEQQDAVLQETLTQLRYEEILSDDPAVYRESPEDFGLAEPLVTVTVRYTDKTEITLHVGSDTGLEERWHYLTVEGDERLYAVSSAIVQDLDLEYAVLRPVPRPEIYAALLDRITVEDGEKKIAEWKLQGQITDRDAGSNWTVTVPFQYPADEETIKKLKESAGNIRLGVYSDSVTEENLIRYGLDVPRRIITFHMAAGSTGTVSGDGIYDVADHDEKTVVFMIGNDADETASYVRFGDEIFTVNRIMLTAFADPDPMNTVARYPVLTSLESLESLTVEKNGEIREYRLQIIPREDGEAGEEQQERECRMNGETVSYNAFEAAYDRLLTVTFSGVLPEGAVWKDPYKKYTFHTLSGGTHTVVLSDWDGIHDAVTVDGSTLFYLIKGGMTDLPTDRNEPESR